MHSIEQLGDNVRWTAAEKKVARRAFDQALERHLSTIMAEAKRMMANVANPSGLWEVEAYLSESRKTVDRIYGSAQELVETRILGCFLKNDEFGLGDRHALGLEQQVAEILVTAAPSKKSLDVAVDGFHHSEAYFGAAVVQDPVQVIQQHKGKFLKGCQPLPAQLIDPTLQIAQHGSFIVVGPQPLQAFL